MVEPIALQTFYISMCASICVLLCVCVFECIFVRVYVCVFCVYRYMCWWMLKYSRPNFFFINIWSEREYLTVPRNRKCTHFNFLSVCVVFIDVDLRDHSLNFPVTFNNIYITVTWANISCILYRKMNFILCKF